MSDTQIDDIILAVLQQCWIDRDDDVGEAVIDCDWSAARASIKELLKVRQ